MERNFKLEICLESAESAIIAEKAGADRVELCDNLFEGGTTPSYGMIQITNKYLKIPLHVIVRPRGGDFCYSDIEFEVMKEDIKFLKKSGVEGVVLGVLQSNGQIDIERTKELIELSRPMSVTFHRAFDMALEPYQALEDVIKTGADRLLTSGQEKTSIEGIPLIREMIKIAGNRIIIMPGAGINNRNYDYLLKETKAKEIHMSANSKVPSNMTFRPTHLSMGGHLTLPEHFISKTDYDKVKSIINKEK